jgi:hypothetical protein
LDPKSPNSRSVTMLVSDALLTLASTAMHALPTTKTTA